MVASVQFHAFRRSSETFVQIAARVRSTLSPHPRAAHLRERCHSPYAIEILMFHFHAWSSPRLMAKLPWPLCILCAKLNSPSPFRLTGASFFQLSCLCAPFQNGSAHAQKRARAKKERARAQPSCLCFPNPICSCQYQSDGWLFIVMPWRQIERFPRCCLAFVCAPTFALDLIKKRAHARPCRVMELAKMPMDQKEERRQWKSKRERPIKTLIPIEDFQLLFRVRLLFAYETQQIEYGYRFTCRLTFSLCSHVQPLWLSGLIPGANKWKED